MRFLAVLAVLFIGTATAFAADPVGSYAISGTNPGGGSHYSGTARVSKTGDTYRVVWTIDGTQYVGTGLGDKDFLAVSYKSGNSTGLALFGADGGNWEGVWTYANSNKVGTEIWKRQ